MTDTSVEIIDDDARWHAREVTYWRGKWPQLRKLIPTFEIRDFTAGPDLPSNPYMRSVIRLPIEEIERPMPVGNVSNTYKLAQHYEVAEICLEGIAQAGVTTSGLTCDLRLTSLGEWMHLSIFFPDKFNYVPPDGNRLALRLECFNSVDGSSRLVILLGWYRFVCANGLVIGETKVELRDIHNQRLDLMKIPPLIAEGLNKVSADRERLERWGQAAISKDRLVPWVNDDVTQAWGKTAASRTYHICTSGHDVEFVPPFENVAATQKQIRRTIRVPGAGERAANLYDVSQALSWIASKKTDPDERLDWQLHITTLIEQLAVP